MVPALQENVELFEQRTCVRHVYANMKKHYGGGSVLRDSMLAACKATYHASWTRRMLELKAVSKDAHDWFMEIDPNLWVNFSEYSKCDIIMNNISEAFNGRILEARDLPIISMFEWIRVYLMSRFAKNRLLVEKYNGKGKICPKGRKRLDKEVLDSGKWTATWAGGSKFEVVCYPAQFEVDLENRNCACRFWGLTGIPCRHAIAAIFCNKEDPHDYVDRYYWVDTYEQVYALIINLVNGEQLWQPTGLPPVKPPHCRTRIRRPKKAIRRERDDPPRPNKLRRQNTSITCSKCGNYGYNRKLCHNLVSPTTDASTQGGGGRGRGRGRSTSVAVSASQTAATTHTDVQVGASIAQSSVQPAPVATNTEVCARAALSKPVAATKTGMQDGAIAPLSHHVAATKTGVQAAFGPPPGFGPNVNHEEHTSIRSAASKATLGLRPKLPIQKGPSKWNGQPRVTGQQL